VSYVSRVFARSALVALVACGAAGRDREPSIGDGAVFDRSNFTFAPSGSVDSTTLLFPS
jgi:hypothetical protein